MFFKSATAAAGGDKAHHPAGGPSLKPGSLRRIKLFAELEEPQLEVFVQMMEVLSFKQFATVVKAGDHGDSMYLVLEGEVRARNMIEGRETTLEVALLDHGPRSADVVANQDSLLLRISAQSIERLVRESPAVAAPFLHALSRAIVGRVRGLIKKYQDSIQFSRLAGAAA
jgi:CRP-like cAMP-binding protein